MRQIKQLLQKLRPKKRAHYLILGLLICGGLLRVWNVHEAALFLGDQGRDAIVVSRIFREQDLVFIGPITSIGNMYLGPLYYYFMLPFLILSYPSPLGPVYAVVVLGILTIFLLYLWGRELVGEKAALFAGVLAAFSVALIELSRYSWNPNPTPFAGLLLLYAWHRAVTKHPKYWLLVGVASAILIQLHYVTLLGMAAVGLWWLGTVVRGIYTKQWQLLRQVVGYGFGALLIVVFSLMPLVIFDTKHEWLNVRALTSLLTNTDNFTTSATEPTSLASIFREAHGRSMHLLFEELFGQLRTRNTIGVVLVVIGVVAVAVGKPINAYRRNILQLALFIGVAVLGLSTYRHSVFTHYIGYLFPAVCLLLGYFLAEVWKMKVLGKIAVGAVLATFMLYNVPQYSFSPAGPSMSTLRAVSASIHSRVRDDEPYAIALLTATKDYHGMNYRFFLESDRSKKPVYFGSHETAERLFIISEQAEIEAPENEQIYEIKSFPGQVVTERYTIPGGPSITVLSRSSNQTDTASDQ